MATVNDSIARILKAEGVEWVAAFPQQTLIDAVTVAGIRPIITRTERTGVNMADGFSRVRNREAFGVFTMQQGPGAENAYPGAAQAFADSIPLLLLPGGPPVDRTQAHPNFEAALGYRRVTKWAANINLPGRVPELMRVAFSQMRHGRPGPVLVEIPADLGGEETPDFGYEPPRERRSKGDEDDVRDLVGALLRAERPVILAGHGTLWARAWDELAAFAEMAAVPVMTTMAAKGVFPEDHELALGTGGHSGTLMAARFLERADFVLAIGSSLTKSTFAFPLPEQAVVAQVTNDPADLDRDHAVDHGALGDARLVLGQMTEEVRRQAGEEGRDRRPVAAAVAEVRKEFEDQWRPLLLSDEVPINPYRVFTEMAAAVPPAEAIVTHDSGYPRDQLLPMWRTVTPRGYLGWGKSTQLGYGLGLALGAKLGAPEKTVINVMGDAAFGMAGMDVETAVRAEIPILTVVLNNGVMTHYDKNLPEASRVHGVDRLGGCYSGVARELGAHAERVDQPGEVRAAFERAVAANREGRPAVVEVMTKAEERVARYL